jgi:hypothetical protein
MSFYEVHDDDGCLIKTRNFRAAKRSAIALLTMKKDRMVHIKVFDQASVMPTASMKFDPATATWRNAKKPTPVQLGLAECGHEKLVLG